MGEKDKNVEQPQPTVGYQFKKEVHQLIYEFLNKRPYNEVENIIIDIFESQPHEKTFISPEGLQHLTDYLSSCPRAEVRPLLEILKKKDSLSKFNIESKKEN